MNALKSQIQNHEAYELMIERNFDKYSNKYKKGVLRLHQHYLNGLDELQLLFQNKEKKEEEERRRRQKDAIRIDSPTFPSPSSSSLPSPSSLPLSSPSSLNMKIMNEYNNEIQLYKKNNKSLNIIARNKVSRQNEMDRKMKESMYDLLIEKNKNRLLNEKLINIEKKKNREKKNQKKKNQKKNGIWLSSDLKLSSPPPPPPPLPPPPPPSLTSAEEEEEEKCHLLDEFQSIHSQLAQALEIIWLSIGRNTSSSSSLSKASSSLSTQNLLQECQNIRNNSMSRRTLFSSSSSIVALRDVVSNETIDLERAMNIVQLVMRSK
jgi:hypothetical protein